MIKIIIKLNYEYIVTIKITLVYDEHIISILKGFNFF
jgi:hypothetical protein